jgi:AraC family transcriptional regulator
MGMTATTIVEDGVRVTMGRAGRFQFRHIVFPGSSFLPAFDPEFPYVVVVLDGEMDKIFARSTQTLGAGSIVTMPAGARHATRFGRTGTTVLLLLPAEEAAPAHSEWDGIVAGLRHVHDGRLTGLGWRVAGELAASDSVSRLAAEGYGLELVSGLMRGADEGRTAGRPPAWLAPVRDRLHELPGAAPGLGELAAEVGVHPSHLARVFRRHHGTSIGAYARRLRLDWATAQLAAGEECLALLAAEAGFADQSHFTRSFKRHTGLTPARYRSAVRGD